jgi:hypothetical protein
VVLTIADYLECTMIERNQLLTAARYAIEHPGPGGTELRRVFGELRVVIDALPFPAYAVSRDWTMQLINDHLLVTLGLARADVAGLPASSRNVLRLLFDPALPVRRLLEPDQASWSQLAAFSIVRFRQDNVLWQYDPWYQGLIAKLSDLPDFSRYWRLAQSGQLADAAASGLASARITVSRPDGRALCLRPLNIELHGIGFPGIVGFLPADTASSEQLRTLGVPSPANHWGAVGQPDLPIRLCQLCVRGATRIAGQCLLQRMRLVAARLRTRSVEPAWAISRPGQLTAESPMTGLRARGLSRFWPR